MEITCMYKLFAKRILVYVLSVSMLCVGMPSSAGVIGTQTLLDAEQSTGSLERVEAFLARDRVRDQMVAFGVEPQEVQRRVSALTQQELSLLDGQLETLPAGGLLAVIGVVFIVLLILELVGVINIFQKF
jgi:hypothetical protein